MSIVGRRKIDTNGLTIIREDYVVLRDAILPDEITALGNFFLDFRKLPKSGENTRE